LTTTLENLLVELEAFGQANDGATTDRPRRMLNITRDTGELLAVLVRATLARRVLEIGTSNGYSTLWLASAARAQRPTASRIMPWVTPPACGYRCPGPLASNTGRATSHWRRWIRRPAPPARCTSW